MNLKGAKPERFGSIASFLYRKLAEPTLAPMHGRIASDVPIERGRLLDVGCGPGQLTRRIARERRALSVVGLDPSEDMIRQARRDSSVANLEFRVGSPASAGFAEEFDFALSVLSFHHWEEPEEELAALHRALRPGGRLWIYESDPEASNADLRADRGPIFGWIRFPAALERYLSRGHGFTRREVETAVAPAVARTPFRALEVTPAASTLRLELERRAGGA